MIKFKRQDLTPSARGFVVLAGFFFAVAGLCGEPLAGDAAHFIRDGIGARARGLGGTFVAVADDVTAVFWNPAGLVQSPSFRLGTSYSSRFGGLLSSSSAMVALGQGPVGMGAMYFTEDIYNMLSLGVGLAHGRLRLGGAVKLYSFSARTEIARGVGFDLGLLLSWSEGRGAVAVGFVSRDIGWTRIRWRGLGLEVVDAAAWVNQLGLAFREPFVSGEWLFTGALEIALRRPPREGEPDYLEKNLEISLSAGVEFALGGVYFRTGFSRLDPRRDALPKSFTAGIGVSLGGLKVDMTWEQARLGPSYTASLEMSF